MIYNAYSFIIVTLYTIKESLHDDNYGDDTKDTSENNKRKDVDDGGDGTVDSNDESNVQDLEDNSEQFDKDKLLPSETYGSQEGNGPNPPSNDEENFEREKDEQGKLLPSPTRENQKPQPGENEITQPKETDESFLDKENPQQNQTSDEISQVKENDKNQASENAIHKPWESENNGSENEQDSWSEDNKWVNVPLNASEDDDIMEDIKEQNKNKKDGKKTKGSCCVIS